MEREVAGNDGALFMAELTGEAVGFGFSRVRLSVMAAHADALTVYEKRG